MLMHLATDADLLRARTDPQFRQALLADSLELLLAALKRFQGGDIGPEATRQMKEGAALAVQLADRLQRQPIVSDPEAA
jgi:hypothetical protein